MDNSLIRRQDAIEAIDGVLMEDEQYKVWLKIAIKNVPSAQQWIPCSERLPEESGWHTCTCHDGVSERVTFLKWQKRLKQWEQTGSRSYWKVIAWMPLPEPYEGVEE